MGILFLGDFFYSYDYIAQDILELSSYIRRNNYSVILNLEGPIAQDLSLTINKRGEHLSQSITVTDVLNYLNVKGVILSNNHSFDFSADGIINTMRLLDEHGIQYTGLVNADGVSQQPITLLDNNIIYHIYSATDPFEESFCSSSEMSCLEIKDLPITNTAQCNKDIRLAFLHTGFEYNTLPTITTIKECRKLIDCGFDGVICSHPHIIQPYEKYNDKYIFYSLGNFYFSEYRQEFSQKRIAGKAPHYCDIGHGVIYENGKYADGIEIRYIPSENKSCITDNFQAAKLPASCFSWKYKHMYYTNRNNHNFLLTGNKLTDDLKMRILNNLYRFYRTLKGIIKR